jgi:hypothetical protein
VALLVALPRFSLPVESAGSFAAIGGTYIIVKLDLPPPLYADKLRVERHV